MDAHERGLLGAGQRGSRGGADHDDALADPVADLQSLEGIGLPLADAGGAHGFARQAVAAVHGVGAWGVELFLTTDGRLVVSSDEIVTGAFLPRRVIVVGGGAVGCEFASYFRDLGAETTIVEMLPAIVPLEGVTCSTIGFVRAAAIHGRPNAAASTTHHIAPINHKRLIRFPQAASGKEHQ